MYTNILSIGFILLASVVYGNPYVQQVIVPQRVIQYDQGYFIGANGYYKAGEQIAQDKAKSADDKVNQLESEVKDLKTELAELIKVLKGERTAVETKPEVPPPPKPADNLEDQVSKLLKTKCFQCHANGNNGSKFLDADGKLVADYKAAIKVHHRTEAVALDKGEARMPKGGAPLTNAEVILLKKWLNTFAR